MASLNVFGSGPPKQIWLRRFFSDPDEFLTGHDLSRDQHYFFCRFLRDANLLTKTEPTAFAYFVKNFGWDKAASLGLMLVNLVAVNKQIRWFIENIPLEKIVLRTEVEAKILSTGLTKNSTRAILRSFRHLSGTAFGTVLKFIRVTYIGCRLDTLTRTKAKVTDGRVILYSLYKLAEAVGVRQFTLSELIVLTASPAKIFGLSVEELEQFLNGLSANHPEFIDATFTHDLNKVTLKPDVFAEDILTLFEG